MFFFTYVNLKKKQQNNQITCISDLKLVPGPKGTTLSFRVTDKTFAYISPIAMQTNKIK